MTLSETELRQVLPWHVNGTLDMDTQQAINRLIGRSPLVCSEVIWLQQLRRQIQNLPDRTDERSPSAGLDTLLALVRAEQSGKVVSLPMRGRMRAWFALPRKFSVPVGMAAAVLLAQAAIIGSFLTRAPTDQLTPLAADAPTTNALLQITFKSTATDTQIRSLLASVHGVVVAEPGALRIYMVRVPDGQSAAALAKLRDDRSAIESIVLLPGRQPAAPQ